MKNSFTLIELILVIVLLSFISTIFYFNPSDDKLKSAAKRLEIYLKQTRYQALIDNKEDLTDNKWHRKRWTLKFFNCRSSVGGLYYVIYSDENKGGQPNENESLIDPLTKKRVYASNMCQYDKNRSKYTLLTKEFGIKEIKISCNDTSTIGQLSFGNDGKVYTKLSTYDKASGDYELQEKCTIDLISQESRKETIEIEPKTGFIKLK